LQETDPNPASDLVNPVVLSSDLHLHFSAATANVKPALVMNSNSKNAPSRSVTTCFTAVISNAHWLSPASSQIQIDVSAEQQEGVCSLRLQRPPSPQIATCRISVGVVHSHLKWRRVRAFRERTED